MRNTNICSKDFFRKIIVSKLNFFICLFQIVSLYREKAKIAFYEFN